MIIDQQSQLWFKKQKIRLLTSHYNKLSQAEIVVSQIFEKCRAIYVTNSREVRFLRHYEEDTSDDEKIDL